MWCKDYKAVTITVGSLIWHTSSFFLKHTKLNLKPAFCMDGGKPMLISTDSWSNERVCPLTLHHPWVLSWESPSSPLVTSLHSHLRSSTSPGPSQPWVQNLWGTAFLPFHSRTAKPISSIIRKFCKRANAFTLNSFLRQETLPYGSGDGERNVEGENTDQYLNKLVFHRER